MIGYPRHLNTKADYEYVKKHYPDKYEEEMQKLLKTKDNYFAVKTLEKGEIGVETETMKIVEIENTDGIIERVQMELKPDPNSKFYKLGFSDEE